MPCSVWSCGTLCCAARWCSRRPDQNFFTRPGQIRPDDQTRWMDGGTPPGGTTTRRIGAPSRPECKFFFWSLVWPPLPLFSHPPTPLALSCFHSPPPIPPPPPRLCGSVALWCVLCFNASSYQRPLPFFSLLLHPQAPPTRHPRFPGDDVSCDPRQSCAFRRAFNLSNSSCCIDSIESLLVSWRHRETNAR